MQAWQLPVGVSVPSSLAQDLAKLEHAKGLLGRQDLLTPEGVKQVRLLDKEIKSRKALVENYLEGKTHDKLSLLRWAEVVADNGYNLPETRDVRVKIEVLPDPLQGMNSRQRREARRFSQGKFGGSV